MTYHGLSKLDMARRVAADIPDGSYVNLGIGLPTLVADVAPPCREICYHSENGVLGVGPRPAPEDADPELVNAGKQLVSIVPGGAYVHHTDSFVMIRGGHLDVTVLGAFQVSERGDLANWATNDTSLPPAVGGAMDLAVGAARVYVLMAHTTKSGQPKILKECTYPLTASRVVTRIFTDLAVIDTTESGLRVLGIVEELDPAQLQDLTGARLQFADELEILRHTN